MTNEQRNELGAVLGGYWYDRDEDDAAIVAELERDLSREEKQRLLTALDEFLSSEASLGEKAAFIRRNVWRSLTTDDKAVAWLKTVRQAFE